jgi:hypothetical protein
MAKKKKLTPGPQPDGGYVLDCSPKVDYAKLRPDMAQTAYRTMLEATGQAPKSLPAGQRPKGERSAAAVKQGKAGGLKGGKARADKLTPERRSEIAKRAAAKRWKSGDSEGQP